MVVYRNLALCIVAIMLVGAAPATKPTNKPAKVPTQTQRVITYRRLERIIERLPRNLWPERGGRWTNLHIARANDWMREHMVGNRVMIKVYPILLSTQKEKESEMARAICEYNVEIIPERGTIRRYMPRAASWHGFDFYFGIDARFPMKEADKLSKVKLTNISAVRGDAVELKGTIKGVKLSSNERQVITSAGKLGESDVSVSFLLDGCTIR